MVIKFNNSIKENRTSVPVKMLLVIVTTILTIIIGKWTLVFAYMALMLYSIKLLKVSSKTIVILKVENNSVKFDFANTFSKNKNITLANIKVYFDGSKYIFIETSGKLIGYAQTNDFAQMHIVIQKELNTHIINLLRSL